MNWTKTISWNNHKVAVIVAVIVGLAEVVIVYDLWLAGSWLADYPILSVAKTTAFVLLFVGSLIAEMQQLSKTTRWLLFVAVVVLGLYQVCVNVVVNYHSANIPPSAAEFFGNYLSEAQVKFGVAVVDGLVRTTVVVIMWLVTGQIWRGVAVSKEVDPTQADISRQELEGLQAAYDSLIKLKDNLTYENETTKNQLKRHEKLIAAMKKWDKQTKTAQVDWIIEHTSELNGNGPTNAEIAQFVDCSAELVRQRRK